MSVSLFLRRLIFVLIIALLTFLDLPTVTVKRSSLPDEAFPIGKQLENVAEKLLSNFYRLPSSDLMDPVEYGSVFQYMYTEMVRRLPSLSEYCM